MAAPETDIDWHFARYGARWGLRGDPVLWDRMQSHFAKAGLPETQDAFRAALLKRFEDITGTPLNPADKAFGVENLRRKEGGMSNGMVDPSTWHRYLIPLLLTRHIQWRAVQHDLTVLPAIAPDDTLIPATPTP